MTASMTGTADVSVVIPVFNSGVTAIAAIESVLGQTVKVREILVVDDGSIDGSGLLVAERFHGIADLVKVFRIDNVGAAGARNHGVSRASSAYIAFLDSDDLWMSTKLEKQLGVINDVPSVGMVGTQTTMGAKKSIDPGVGRSAKPVVVSSTMQLFKNFFQTSTVLVRRSVLDSVGHFPTGQRYAEEGDLFIRIAAHSKCILLNEVLVDYCGGKGGFGEAGLSANLNAMECGELGNIYRALQRGNCGSIVFLAAIFFSVLKFSRRQILQTLRPATRRTSV
jgi:glycosyltransferase involved in cell wall biosynthesis